MATLNQEMTQAVIRGDDYRRVTNNIARRMNVSKGAAGRLVMTESAFFATKAQQDCFKELDVEKYEFIATLDSHTSDICRHMDGKVFKVSDMKPGITAHYIVIAGPVQHLISMMLRTLNGQPEAKTVKHIRYQVT